MKRNETPCKANIMGDGSGTIKHSAQFIGVRDSRNRRIAGLYQRNGRFYAQLWVDHDDGKKTARKFPLLTPDGAPVSNLVQAKEAADVLRNDRGEKKLPTSGHKPKFADYVETYFAKPVTATKKPDTLKLERWSLNRWKEHLGDVRIDRIDAAAIASLRDKRLRAGSHPRTVNLDLIALRNVLKQAVEDDYLREMPKAKTLKVPPAPKRPLISSAQFDALLAAVPRACAKNAVQFADYLRFLAFSGAREVKALKVRWSDVDFEAQKVTIGSGGVVKNRDSRAVDFNPRLGELLRDMHGRRAPDCTWLFPSPQRGPRDEHAKTFRESLLIGLSPQDTTPNGYSTVPLILFSCAQGFVVPFQIGGCRYHDSVSKLPSAGEKASAGCPGFRDSRSLLDASLGSNLRTAPGIGPVA